MNTPVSFQISKLLKEKGYKETVKSYNENGKLITVSLTIRKYKPEEVYYPAPNIFDVIMWIYEKHNIWILVEHYNNDEPKYIYWGYTITKNNDADFLEMDNQYFWETPTEAYSAAIEYTLNNLI